MKKTNTDKIELIYNYIIEFTEEHGYAPTVREIGSHFGIASTSNVFYYLDKLKKLGKIASGQNKYRSITTTAPATQKKNIVMTPLVGKVSAGQGAFAEEDIEGYYALPRELYNKDEQFLLRVNGESMKDVGICDGDYVVVARQSNADIDDIVVVYWQEKATVKRLASINPFILHPENATLQDIVLTESDNPVILGKVIGCLKKF